MIESLAEHPWVQTAARLGKAYGTNPIHLLDLPYHQYMILLACAKVTAADNERERKEAESRRSGG